MPLLACQQKTPTTSANRVQRATNRPCHTSIHHEEIVAIQAALLQPERKWACIGQVTGNVERWQTFVQGLTALDIPVHVTDTVCTDSYDRQSEAAALAREVDVVIVVDDGGGASTSVYDACRQANPRTYRYGTTTPYPAGAPYRHDDTLGCSFHPGMV